MRGTNIWHGVGEVIGDLVFGRTGNDDDACSFRMRIIRNDRKIIVRVNVYGRCVDTVRNSAIATGDYVAVVGECMTRPYRDDMFMEIRCTDVSPSEDTNVCLNEWYGSGTLVDNILYSETRAGAAACTFRLSIHSGKAPVSLRFNAYDGIVDSMKARGFVKGDILIVRGEVMNRNSSGLWLAEIRCLSVDALIGEEQCLMEK